MNNNNNKINKFRISCSNEQFVGCKLSTPTFLSFKNFIEAIINTFHLRITSSDRRAIFFRILDFYICVIHSLDSKLLAYICNENKYLNIPTFVYNLLMKFGLESHTGNTSPGFVRGRVFSDKCISFTYKSLVLDMDYENLCFILNDIPNFLNFVSEDGFELFHTEMVDYFENRGYSLGAPLDTDNLLYGLSNLNTLFYYRDKIELSTGMLPFPKSNKLGIFRYRCGEHFGEYIFSPLYENKVDTNFYDLMLFLFEPVFLNGFDPKSDLLSNVPSVTEESFYIGGLEARVAWSIVMSFSNEQFVMRNANIQINSDKRANPNPRIRIPNQDTPGKNNSNDSNRKFSTFRIPYYISEVSGFTSDNTLKTLRFYNYRYPHLSVLFSVIDTFQGMLSDEMYVSVCLFTISTVVFTKFVRNNIFLHSNIPPSSPSGSTSLCSSFSRGSEFDSISDKFVGLEQKFDFELVHRMLVLKENSLSFVYCNYDSFLTELNFGLLFEGKGNSAFLGFYISHFTNLNLDILYKRALRFENVMSDLELPNWFVSKAYNTIYINHFGDLITYDQFLLMSKYIFFIYI